MSSPHLFTPKDRTRTEHIGAVDRIIFPRPGEDGDFVILALTDGGTALGPGTPDAFPRGSFWRFFGKWEDDQARGPRFRFATCVVHHGHSRTGVVTYLTRSCSGIGDKLASRLFEKYGGGAVEQLRTDPLRVATETGIALDTCTAAAAELESSKKYEATRVDLFGLFAGRGFQGKLIEAAIEKWQVRAPAVIRKNPFSLLGMVSAGFKRCDRLWSDLALPPNALKRQAILAAHSVRNDSNGHTWLSAAALADVLVNLIPKADPRRAFKFALRARLLKKYRDAAGTLWLADYGRATAEERIAARVHLLNQSASLWPAARVPVSRTDGDRLPSAHQVERLTRATVSPVGLLLGSPGTGKSHSLAYLLREVIADFGRSSVAVCAPTGKAAVRASQALALAGLDLQAKTIHSTLKIGRNGHDGDGWGFEHCAGNPLPFRFVVVDECFTRGTMVDTPLGPRPIESIRADDEVYSAAGADRVIAAKRKEVTSAIRITAGKATFTCSENHQFFTHRGWVSAIDLRPGEALVSTAASMRLLRQDHHSVEVVSGSPAFLRTCLLRELVDAVPGTQGQNTHFRIAPKERPGTGGLSAVGNVRSQCSDGPHPQVEPDVESGFAGKGECFTSRTRMEAIGTGREWARSYRSSEVASLRTRESVETGVCCSSGRATEGLPDELQAGHGKSIIESGHRGGRELSLGKEAPGREEGCEVAVSRVDRVEVLEPGHPDLDQFRDAEGKLYLYDLAVARHPSFSVNGCLVHNCSMVDCSLLADLLDACARGTHVLFVGDTGQLPPVGHGAPLRDLIAAGVPHGELTEVRRNAGQIVHACVRIKNGESFDTADVVDLDATPPKNLKLLPARDEAEARDTLTRLLQSMKRFHPVWQTQVIVARNKKGELSRTKLNELLHPLLNPDGYCVAGNPFKVGDKIICTRNSRMHRVELPPYIIDLAASLSTEEGRKRYTEKSLLSLNSQLLKEFKPGESADASGVVYVASGFIDGSFKIGYTGRSDTDLRLNELRSLHGQPSLRNVVEIKSADAFWLEQMLHRVFWHIRSGHTEQFFLSDSDLQLLGRHTRIDRLHQLDHDLLVRLSDEEKFNLNARQEARAKERIYSEEHHRRHIQQVALRIQRIQNDPQSLFGHDLMNPDWFADNYITPVSEDNFATQKPGPEEVYVANGEIGRVVAVAKGLTVARFSEGEMLVKIPMGKQREEDGDGEGSGGDGGEGGGRGCNFDLAYAVTCHKCVHPDTLVETGEGFLPIRLVGDSGLVATPTGANHYPVRFINPNGPALRVETEHGYEITLTPDHGIEVWDGGSYVRGDASDLRPGDWLRLKLGVTLEPNHGGALPPAPPHDVRSTVYRLPERVTEDVAEFLGLMVADGTVFESGFRLVKRHPEVGERFAELCRSIFGCKPSPYTNGNVSGYEIRSRFLSDWLLQIGGLAPNAKAVPESILRSPIWMHRKFLRGLFEDGTVNLGRDGTCDHIEWLTVYPELARLVHAMLLRCGIFAKRTTRANDRREGGYQVLYLYGESSVTFRDTIGFISRFKQDRLVGCRTGNAKYKMPISKTRVGELRRVAGKSAGDNLLARGTISRNTAAQMGWTEELEWIHSRVETITPTTCTSMCLEVPVGHRFLQNGFPFWNCQGSEWPCIVIMGDKDSGLIANREWIYTAVSRASKLCILVGQMSTFDKMRMRQSIVKRKTFLKELIVEMGGAAGGDVGGEERKVAA